MYNKCCVVGCASRRKEVHLYKFPKSEIALRKWLECLNCERLRSLSFGELQKHSVCRKHFEKRFHVSTRVRSRLPTRAYPTLFTASEISSGIPETPILPLVYQEKEHGDHTYYKETESVVHQVKQHGDHTYCKQTESETFVESPSRNVEMYEVSSPPHTEPIEMSLPNATFVESPSSPNVEMYDVSSPPHTEPIEMSLEINETFVESPASPNVEMYEVSSPPHTEPIEMSLPNDNVNTPKSKKRIICRRMKRSPSSARLHRIQRQALRYQQSRKFTKIKFFEKYTKKMNPLAKQFVWMQIKHHSKKARGRRFSNEEKLLALSIMKESKKCYRFLQNIFILPSIYTLKKMLANLNAEPIRVTRVLKYLAVKKRGT